MHNSLWITLLMKFRNMLKTLGTPVTQAPVFVDPALLKPAKSNGLRQPGCSSVFPLGSLNY
jgi:hypothetical protein